MEYHYSNKFARSYTKSIIYIKNKILGWNKWLPACNFNTVSQVKLKAAVLKSNLCN